MEESREHSNLLDRKFLDNNSAFFFKTLRPRLSHYAVRADDACIQTQIDVFGKEHVGIMPGSLAPSGNFAATVYSESLPDRLPILAYLNEILSFYEAFEETLAEIMGAKLELRVHKDPKFDNPTWQSNFKEVLPKIIKILCEADPVHGTKCIQEMKDLAETPNLSRRIGEYKDMDDYLNDRILDIAWPSVSACAAFGANLTLMEQERSSTDQVFWPLWAHSSYVYDFYMWEKELRTAAKFGTEQAIVSGIPLLKRLHGLSVEDAKAWLRNKCLEFEQEYLHRKDEFFKTHTVASLSGDLLKWFDCQEAIATGFAIWCTSSYRHHPPFEVGYQEYFEKRCKEGALWFDNCAQSESLMTGGLEVSHAAGKVAAS